MSNAALRSIAVFNYQVPACCPEGSRSAAQRYEPTPRSLIVPRLAVNMSKATMDVAAVIEPMAPPEGWLPNAVEGGDQVLYPASVSS